MDGLDPSVPCQATSQITSRPSEIIYKKDRKTQGMLRKLKTVRLCSPRLRPRDQVLLLPVPWRLHLATSTEGWGVQDSSALRSPLLTLELSSQPYDLVPFLDPVARTGARGRVGVGARWLWHRPEAELHTLLSVHRALTASLSHPVPPHLFCLLNRM